MAKYFFIITCLLFVPVVGQAHENNSGSDYFGQARAWCSDIVKQKLSTEEITLLLNLLYFSAQRSADIITMQKAVARYASATAPLLNDAISARRNPAKISSVINYSTQKWDAQLQQFDDAHAQLRPLLQSFRANAAAYAHCLEHLIKNNGIRSELLYFIEQLRENARQAMMATMRTNATSIATIKDTLKKIMGSFSNESRSLEESVSEHIQRGIVDCLANFAAPAAMSSFIKLDQNYSQFNKVAWNALITGYEVNNLLWDMLEQTRFDFYQAHYAAFSALITQSNCAGPFLIAFDADGYIAPALRLGEKSVHVFI